MVEVTIEMVDAAAQAFTTKPTEATYVVARRMIEAALKVHEANKPKPEPVAFMFKSDKHPDGVFFLANTYPMNGTPVYTAPPTREPLSDYELREMLNDLNEGDGTIYDFARAIEKAHGIGV